MRFFWHILVAHNDSVLHKIEHVPILFNQQAPARRVQMQRSKQLADLVRGPTTTTNLTHRKLKHSVDALAKCRKSKALLF